MFTLFTQYRALMGRYGESIALNISLGFLIRYVSLGRLCNVGSPIKNKRKIKFIILVVKEGMKWVKPFWLLAFISIGFKKFQKRRGKLIRMMNAS